MLRLLLLTIVSFTTALNAQKATVNVPSSPSASAPKMESGVVEDNTYRNPSVGVELTVANGLTFQEPELMGTSGTVPELVTITALQKETLFTPRYVTVFYADALGAYPESQRSTESYMRKISRGNQETGYKVVQENLQITFGGTVFARTDFQGPLYEAVLAKSCGRQALVFIFGSTSGKKEDVEKLIDEHA